MENWEKTILISGGAGFIGSHFVEYIFDHHPYWKIIILDALTYAGHLKNIPDYILKSNRFSFWYGNIKDRALVFDLVKNVDIVIHMAAESHVARSLYDDLKFFETDLIGTQSIASAAVRCKKNIELFVHISTSEVYGTAVEIPMSENHPLNPTTPYASAKCAADRLIYSYIITYGLPGVILRPFNNYGPRQHLEKVIPRFIVRALKNEPLIIHGTGEVSRDWTFVTDCCVAIDNIICAQRHKVSGKIFNIGSIEIKIKDIAQFVKEFTGSSSPIQHIVDRPGQVKRHVSSTQKIKNTIGWQPQISFEEGLKKTIKWYQQHYEWWKDMDWMLNLPYKTWNNQEFWL
jgi:dTDP-glucose 4,6-dehydratase